ncbi:MAG: hypothetical protein N3C60_02610 [Calditerrivibrio sp.]|nr:hypothetical protein [Calditerrivibrio sp.]
MKYISLNKKRVLLLSVFLLSVVIILVLSQTTSNSDSKRHLVGVLLFSEEFRESFLGLQDGLKKTGHNHVDFDIVNINGDLNLVEPTLKRFHEKGIKIIYSTTTPLTHKIKEYNSKFDFFVVYNQIASPIESKLSLDKKLSGTNFVGPSRAAFVTYKKRIQIFKDAFPNIKTIIIFYGLEETFLEKHLNEYTPFAQQLGLEVILSPIYNKEIFSRYHIEDPSSTGIFMAPSAFSVRHFEQIKKLAEKYAVPIMAIDTYLVKKGATIAYSQSFYNDGIQASYYLDLLLKGINPKYLPIQLPNYMELYINETAISKLKMPFNKLYYSYADRVIK